MSTPVPLSPSAIYPIGTKESHDGNEAKVLAERQYRMRFIGLLSDIINQSHILSQIITSEAHSNAHMQASEPEDDHCELELILQLFKKKIRNAQAAIARVKTETFEKKVMNEFYARHWKLEVDVLQAKHFKQEGEHKFKGEQEALLKQIDGLKQTLEEQRKKFDQMEAECLRKRAVLDAEQAKLLEEKAWLKKEQESFSKACQTLKIKHEQAFQTTQAVTQHLAQHLRRQQLLNTTPQRFIPVSFGMPSSSHYPFSPNSMFPLYQSHFVSHQTQVATGVATPLFFPPTQFAPPQPPLALSPPLLELPPTQLVSMASDVSNPSSQTFETTQNPSLIPVSATSAAVDQNSSNSAQSNAKLLYQQQLYQQGVNQQTIENSVALTPFPLGPSKIDKMLFNSYKKPSTT